MYWWRVCWLDQLLPHACCPPRRGLLTLSLLLWIGALQVAAAAKLSAHNNVLGKDTPDVKAL